MSIEVINLIKFFMGAYFLYWIMKKIFKFIRSLFISKDFIEEKLGEKSDIRKEHQVIIDLLGDEGKLTKDNNKIIGLLSEDGKLRENLDKILEIQKIEKEVQSRLDKQGIPLNEMINSITLLGRKCAEEETKVKILEDNINLLNEKNEKLIYDNNKLREKNKILLDENELLGKAVGDDDTKEQIRWYITREFQKQKDNYINEWDLER